MMARPIPFLFCRYTFTKRGRPLSADEQHTELVKLRGVTVVHRKGDDLEAEPDTLTMMPSIWLQSGKNGVAWACGYYVRARTEASYDLETDSISQELVGSTGIRYTKFIAVPSLGVVAICDRTSDAHLGALQGVSRLKSVLKAAGKGVEIAITLAATQSDVRQALSNWALDEVSFTVRPFNPHPRDPGRKLSELFERDGIGKVSGSAYAVAGKKMRMAEGGYIEETLGLVEHGYGQVGVSGETESGVKATIKKPTFSDSKQQNTKHQEQPHSLRVQIEEKADDDDLDRSVMKALLDFYEK